MSIEPSNQAQYGQPVIGFTSKAHHDTELKAIAAEMKAGAEDLSGKIKSTNNEVDNHLKEVGKNKSESEKDGNIEEIVKKVNEKINSDQMVKRELEFTIDNESKKTIIKVLDKKTEEVIRQIPTEQLLELERALNKGESVKGLLVKVVA